MQFSIFLVAKMLGCAYTEHDFQKTPTLGNINWSKNVQLSPGRIKFLLKYKN